MFHSTTRTSSRHSSARHSNIGGLSHTFCLLTMSLRKWGTSTMIHELHFNIFITVTFFFNITLNLAICSWRTNEEEANSECLFVKQNWRQVYLPSEQTQLTDSRKRCKGWTCILMSYYGPLLHSARRLIELRHSCALWRKEGTSRDFRLVASTLLFTISLLLFCFISIRDIYIRLKWLEFFFILNQPVWISLQQKIMIQLDMLQYCLNFEYGL